MKHALFICLLALTSAPTLTATEIAGRSPLSPQVCAETFEGLSLPDPTQLARELSTAPRLFKAIAEEQPRTRAYERTKAALVAGDDPNQCGPYGLSPLQLAAGAGRHDLMTLLIQHGARLETPLSSAGNTALGVAIMGGQWAAAHFLLESGASAKVIDAYGESVLHTLALQARDAKAEKAKEVLILRLIDRGAPVNQRNERGYTALMIAAVINNPSAVKLLLAKGADPALRNTKQQTAADLAKLRGHKAVLELLR